MKHFLFIAAGLLLFVSGMKSQESQLLPLQPLSKADSLRLMSLPELVLPASTLKRELPRVVDNSATPYMRPLIAQVGLECGQASSIGIQFTYEINAKRKVPGNLPENQYATHFTYNFLNGGSNAGINYNESFEIIKYAGNPNVSDYGGMSSGGASRWMSGYDKYLNSMKNRVENVYMIKTNTIEGLNTLRNWIFDHGSGSESGGMASFYSQFTSPPNTFPAGSPEAGKHVITQWGSSPNHAMTIVGYHDEIRWDYNGDGQYTNHIDLNGDGIIDVRDWEVGGFKMANTYGSISGWGDQGFSYMMYKTVADATHQGGIWNNQVIVADVKESYVPWLTAKVSLTYPCRNKLKIMAGVALDPLAVEPEFVLNYPMFDFQGGCHPMQGSGSSSTIEIGLDLNPLLNYINQSETVKFFFMVVENDAANSSNGTINSVQLIDYTGDTPVTIAAAQTNVAIQNNTATYVPVSHAMAVPQLSIMADEIPPFPLYTNSSVQLQAQGGSAPYYWYLMEEYDTTESTAAYPAGLGQPLSVSNNTDGSASLDLPFEFPYYGKRYNKLFITVDGFIMFEPSLFTWPFYIAGKSYLIQNKIIAPVLSRPFQISPSAGDGIWADVGTNSVLIRWKLSVYGQSGNSEVSMAARLHSDGTIEFYYGTHNASDWVARFAGISAGDGVNHVIFNKTGFFTPYPQQYVKFVPVSSYRDISLSKSGLLQANINDYFEGQSVRVMVADQNGIKAVDDLEVVVSGLVMNYSVSSGDDGIIEAGETFHLDLDLVNINPFPLNTGTLSLTTEDGWFVITEGSVSGPALPSGSAISLQNVFSVEVHPLIPNHHQAEFTLSYNSFDGSWSRTLMLTAFAPELKVLAVNINDGQNGILEPGETASLVLTIQNAGGARLTDIAATISSQHPDLTVLQGSASHAELLAGENWDAIFMIELSTTALPLQVVEMLLDITAANSYSFQKVIPVITSLVVENFETGDFSLFDWQMSGQTPWTVSNVQPYEGVYAAQSGQIDHNQFSAMSLSWDVAFPDTVSFYYKVSSENNYDWLKFSVNGIQMNQWSGEKPWTKAKYLVQAGLQTFRWRYEKDFSVVGGSDRAWVDYIVLPAKKIYTQLSEKPAENLTIQVSPNPFAHDLTIVVRAETNTQTVLLIADVMGRLVYRESLHISGSGNETKLKINTKHLPKGSFVVMLQSDSGIIVKKVIRAGTE